MYRITQTVDLKIGFQFSTKPNNFVLIMMKFEFIIIHPVFDILGAVCGLRKGSNSVPLGMWM